MAGVARSFLLEVERLFRLSVNTAPQAIRSALFLEYRLPLGCLVHMTPVLEAIKRSRPGIQLAVATHGLGMDVLRFSPYVDHLLDVPDPTVDLRAAVFGLRRQLRALGLRPGCVLTGASDQRTRIALMGMLGATGWRGGYTQKPALYHRPLTYDANLSLIGNNLRLARLLGCDADGTRPRVYFSNTDLAAAQAMLRATNPEGRPVAVMVTQYSGGQRTGWHTERFAAVIRHAALTRGFAVVYVGTSGEMAAIEAIRAAAGGLGTSFAGRTSVTEMSALLALSDIAVTLDTGPMHVGRAAGVPMVVLGPSWQRPLEWLPLKVENARILRGEDREDIPEGYRLDEISAERVIAAMDELIGVYPASEAARAERVRESLSEIDHAR